MTEAERDKGERENRWAKERDDALALLEGTRKALSDAIRERDEDDFSHYFNATRRLTAELSSTQAQLEEALGLIARLTLNNDSAKDVDAAVTFLSEHRKKI